MRFDLSDHPHRRFNPLTGEWILVSPHRTKRPWQGKVEKPADEERPIYDPSCYLCPGNMRAGGAVNPNYKATFVFTNDFPVLLPGTPESKSGPETFFQWESVRGTSRVICFSPRHDLTLPDMPTGEIRAVVDVWAEQAAELGRSYRWVQVFENKGEIMGCSNPHPHGQVWAGNALPAVPAKEDEHQAAYFKEHGRPLLLDYLGAEEKAGKRIIVANDHWVALAPFWATWPFETMVLPRRCVAKLYQLTGDERDALAKLLKRLLVRYDNLFETCFPYSMGWHGAPAHKDQGHWLLHAHFLPPLLRSANIKKFMVGYELLAEPQRDLTVEEAAERLRNLPEVHYRSIRDRC